MSSWESEGKSDDWYTPKYIFDAMGAEFDLDVAAPPDGPRYVPAKDWISCNSLNCRWSGFVWMNPPYGKRNGLSVWLAKFFDHGNGVCLVPDRSSAPWFQSAAVRSAAILFVAGKIKFERPDGSIGKSPGTGSALMASGQTGVEALLRAERAGLGLLLVRPELQA